MINRAIRNIEDGIVIRDKKENKFILSLPYKGDKGHSYKVY